MKKSLCFTIMFILFSTNVFASGLETGAIGSRGFTMGGATYCITEDQSAIHYGPAGLVNMDNDEWNGEFYTFGVLNESEYEENGHKSEGTDVYLLPGFFMARDYGRYAIGIGSYVPFAGGGIGFENISGTGLDYSGGAGWITLSFAAACKVTNNLSIGAGITNYYGTMYSKGPEEAYGDLIVETEYKGYSGMGFNFSFNYKPTDKLSMGMLYRPPANSSLDGEIKIEALNTTLDSKIELTFPQLIVFGISYKINKLLLTATLSEAAYGDFKEIDSTTETPNGTMEESVPSFNKDALGYGIGLEYIYSEKLDIRAGMFYSESALENSDLHYTKIDPDRIQGSLGLGYNISEKIELNFGAVYIKGIESKNDTVQLNMDTVLILLGIVFNI